jgi:acyl-coenzyme A synthetase/AMP-(fatty) acid ligase
MILVLAVTSFIDATLVIGPAKPPAPDTVIDTLKYGQVEVVLLTPAIIEELCLTTTGRDALRDLESVHYAGAPLSTKTGDLLISHTQVVPTIGSTESGGYLTLVHNKKEAWDYVVFSRHAGAVLEHRFDDLHELVFVRNPESELQSIFKLYPDLDRYPTSDLWIEHPVHKGLWKIIGRSDDYVTFTHGEGLHASRLEPEIEAHPAIKSALIGGHGNPAPVLLVELYHDLMNKDDRDQFLASLQINIEKVNAQVHDCVRLSTDRIIIVSKEKPFIRTLKGSVGRMQTLKLYREEVSAFFN